MSNRICSFCGAGESKVVRFESHHIAGLVNHPFYTVIACRDCHGRCSAWQYSQRIPLRSKRDGKGKHMPAEWGDKDIPDDIRLQAILNGLWQAYSLAIAYAGMPDELSGIETMIRGLIRRHPEIFRGATFGENGEFASFKAKNPSPAARMRTVNFERTCGAMFGMLAFIVEECLGEDREMSLRLRELERKPLSLMTSRVPSEEVILTGQLEAIMQDFRGVA